MKGKRIISFNKKQIRNKAYTDMISEKDKSYSKGLYYLLGGVPTDPKKFIEFINTDINE